MPNRNIVVSPWSRRTRVSVSADRMSAYYVREFVKAMDEAGIANNAYITAVKSSEGHFQGLAVTADEEMTDGRETDGGV